MPFLLLPFGPSVKIDESSRQDQTRKQKRRIAVALLSTLCDVQAITGVAIATAGLVQIARNIILPRAVRGTVLGTNAYVLLGDSI